MVGGPIWSWYIATSRYQALSIICDLQMHIDRNSDEHHLLLTAQLNYNCPKFGKEISEQKSMLLLICGSLSIFRAKLHG